MDEWEQKLYDQQRGTQLIYQISQHISDSDWSDDIKANSNIMLVRLGLCIIADISTELENGKDKAGNLLAKISSIANRMQQVITENS